MATSNATAAQRATPLSTNNTPRAVHSANLGATQQRRRLPAVQPALSAGLMEQKQLQLAVIAKLASMPPMVRKTAAPDVFSVVQADLQTVLNPQAANFAQTTNTSSLHAEQNASHVLI